MTVNILTSNIEVASVRSMIITGVLSVVVLAVSVIVGMTGPSSYDHSTYSAYQCPNASHVWNPNCEGPQMGDGQNLPWEVEIGDISSLTRFWSIQMTPYSLDLNTTITSELITGVSITVMTNQGEITLANENQTYSVTCKPGNGPCNTINIIDDEDLIYNLYDIEVRFEGNYSFIGDVVFDVWRAHEKYSNFEISVHLSWVIISSLGVVVYLFHMKSTRLGDWSFEQRFLFLLLLSLLLSNGPLYGLQYVVQGWFVPFLNALFSVLFLSAFSVYSLVILDQIRLDQTKTTYTFSYLAKIALVIVFTILGIILFTWLNVRDHKDPVLGPTQNLNAIQALFYLVACLFIAILLWIVILIIMTIPTLSGRKQIIPKFVMVASPISIYVLSIISGIFAGTFGPLNPNALSVSYFVALNNVFTAVIAFSYWPVKNTSYALLEGDENNSLFGGGEDEEF